MFVLSLWMVITGCSNGPDEPDMQKGKAPTAVDVEDSDVPAVDTAEPELDTIDNGDGSYSYVLPEGFDPGALVVDGPHTWAYVEQAKFSYLPQRSNEETYVARADVPKTLSEKLLGTVRIDAAGRIWTITEVDAALAASRVASVRKTSDELADDYDESAGPHDNGSDDEWDDDVEPMESPGDVITWNPQSWDKDECIHPNGVLVSDEDNHYFMGDDDRRLLTQSFTRRQKAIVEILVDGYGVCTGTILRAKWILTAAHCFFDKVNRPIDEKRVTVISRDGVVHTSHTVEEAIYPGGFTSFGIDPTEDYALVEMEFEFPAGYGDMDLSEAPEGTLDELDDPLNLAVPHFAPYCDPNFSSDAGTHNGLYITEEGELGAVTTQKVNLKLDGGPGHSGSPVFYCPEGSNEVCDYAEQAYVIAVWAGWNSFTTTHVGARVARFYDWGVSLMDGN